MSKRRESKAGRQRRVRSKRRLEAGVQASVLAGAFQTEETYYQDGVATVREVVAIDPPLARSDDWDAYAREVVAGDDDVVEAAVIMADTMTVLKWVRR
jgi:hypothetical protein